MSTIIYKGKIGLEDLYLADSPEYPSAEFSRTGQISTSTLHKIPNIFYSGAESFFDTDGTLADNSDNKSATQKAIKTYVDAVVAALVSNTAFAASWDTVTGIAPSKNAVYDYLATLGTAAFLNVGTSASQVVQLDASAKLPAVDGSQLTGITSGIQYADARLTVVAATRDLTADTADVSYTGAGFTPVAVLAVGGIDGAAFNIAVGYASSTTAEGGAGLIVNSPVAVGANLIYSGTTYGTDYQTGNLKSLDANGCTIAWTKNASPSGTFTFYLIFIR